MNATRARLGLAAPMLAVALLAPARASADDRWPAGAARSAHPPVPARSPPRDPDPWFGPDKALHCGASAALAGGGYALGALVTDDVAGRLAFGAALALGAGLGKEALDAAGLGTPSWRDLAWDVIGATVGLSLSVAIDFAARPAHF